MMITKEKFEKLKKKLCATPLCCQTHGGLCYCEVCKEIDRAFIEE